ncbi:MAG: hypothetical protein KKD44_25855, partial [Proteobacteria bacterium]|nr:hypothetical protein [Pseudomonadota bacterium]
MRTALKHYASPEIERQALSVFLQDPSSVIEELTEAHFSCDEHRILFNLCNSHYERYGIRLTEEALETELNNNPFAEPESMKEALSVMITLFRSLQQMTGQPVEFVLRKLRTFERSRKLLSSIENIFTLFENDKQEEALVFWEESALDTRGGLSFTTYTERGEYLERSSDR